MENESKRTPAFYECGICGGVHRWEWDGDCREPDYHRDAIGPDEEVATMDERVEADLTHGES